MRMRLKRTARNAQIVDSILNKICGNAVPYFLLSYNTHLFLFFSFLFVCLFCWAICSYFILFIAMCVVCGLFRLIFFKHFEVPECMYALNMRVFVCAPCAVHNAQVCSIMMDESRKMNKKQRHKGTT